MQPLQNCTGPTIRIGREILCLPYAGFFLNRTPIFSFKLVFCICHWLIPAVQHTIVWSCVWGGVTHKERPRKTRLVAPWPSWISWIDESTLCFLQLSSGKYEWLHPDTVITGKNISYLATWQHIFSSPFERAVWLSGWLTDCLLLNCYMAEGLAGWQTGWLAR